MSPRAYKRVPGPLANKVLSLVEGATTAARCPIHPRHPTTQYVCPVLATGVQTTATGGTIKRWFDSIVAAFLLLLLAPLFILVALAIKGLDRGPVFFRHRRIGFRGAEFDCLKFRTMTPDAEQLLSRYLADDREAAREWRETHKLKNDPRTTVLGRVLRRSSVDELPQLLNVLKGEMSLVGPRPIVRDELPKYGRFVTEYITARPGLTGLWQVSGRNDIDYSERVTLDCQYVREWNLWQDLTIMVKTFRILVNGRGCY